MIMLRSEVDVPEIKLFAFCKRSFSSLSNRQLRDRFVAGDVLINGQRVRPGHEDESKRVHCGDIIELMHDEKRIQTEKAHAYRLNVLFQHDDFTVLYKDAGISCHISNDFLNAMQMQLWNGERANSLQLLYNLPKAWTGLLVIASTHDTDQQLRQKLVATADENALRLTVRCIVCGKLPYDINLPVSVSLCSGSSKAKSSSGNESNAAEIKQFINQDSNVNQSDSDEEDGYAFVSNENDGAHDSFKVTVKRVVHCRSRQFLSLIDVEPTFDANFIHDYGASTGTRAYHRALHYPSRIIRNIRFFLRRLGFPIVGDGDGVKKSKGMYCSLIGIRIGRRVITTSQPEKFDKLMEKEEEMYQTAANKRLEMIKDCINEGTNEGNILTAVDSDVPLEYIVGKATFCGYDFVVNNRVMIPRKSSEVLVESAINLLHQISLSDDHRDGGETDISVLDLGTGSGCLLLSCLRKLLNMKTSGVNNTVFGIGIDISSEALEVAEENVRRHGLKDFVTLKQCDFTDLLSLIDDCKKGNEDDSMTLGKRCRINYMAKPFDLILCNPPYSSVKERDRLSVSCIKHEPSLAIFGNSSGEALNAYRTIATTLNAIWKENKQYDFVSKNAWLVLEVGHGQEMRVREIFEGLRFMRYMKTVPDAFGIRRCLLFSFCLN